MQLAHRGTHSKITHLVTQTPSRPTVRITLKSVVPSIPPIPSEMALPDASIYHATQHRKPRIMFSFSFDNKHRNKYIYILLFLLFQIDNEDSIIWFSDTIIILDRNLSGILWFLKSCPLGVEEAAARWKKQDAAFR